MPKLRHFRRARIVLYAGKRPRNMSFSACYVVNGAALGGSAYIVLSWNRSRKVQERSLSGLGPDSVVTGNRRRQHYLTPQPVSQVRPRSTFLSTLVRHIQQRELMTKSIWQSGDVGFHLSFHAFTPLSRGLPTTPSRSEVTGSRIGLPRDSSAPRYPSQLTRTTRLPMFRTSRGMTQIFYPALLCCEPTRSPILSTHVSTPSLHSLFSMHCRLARHWAEDVLLVLYR